MSRALTRTAVFFALLTLAVLAQRGGRFPEREADDAPLPEKPAGFHFIRLEYTDLPQYHRGWGWASRNGAGSGWWIVDWPAADNHFTQGIERLTRIDTGDPRHLRLTDDHIFDYPWIYATQTGWWDLSPAETARLREYLLRGGFLVVDDFWGPEAWEVFRQTMQRTLPNEPIEPLDLADPMMHVLYDIQQKDLTFIPGSRHLRRNNDGSATVMQPPGQYPAWLALRDARNRVVVAVNFNTDVGDAWEFADVPYYPEAMTALAYRYGINYIIYSMTH
jgi:Domain of unknown function (DUF4159)